MNPKVLVVRICYIRQSLAALDWAIVMVYDLLKMVEIVSTTIVPIIYDSELITVVGAQDFVNHN